MAAPPAPFQRHAKLVSVAREIAFNMKSVEDILAEYQISVEEWDAIQNDPEFARILQNEITAWGSAQNTGERTRLKAAALMELWLEEAAARLYDQKEGLAAKVELAKLIERMGGISAANNGDGAGNGFRITINIGDNKLSFEKDVTPKVIESAQGG